MIYIFRIESNLLDATVYVTKYKKRAERIIKQNYLKKCDLTGKDCVKKMDCGTYAELAGSKQLPVPYEIVEYGIVRRAKVKR